MTVWSQLATLYYFLATVDKLWLFLRGSRGGVLFQVSDDEALAIPDDDLPYLQPFCCVCTTRRRSCAISSPGWGSGTIHATSWTSCFSSKPTTMPPSEAFREEPADFVTPVFVPPSLPRTKPKACKYGMSLGIDRGEYLTIYDAEDIPDPLQLRRAVAAFRRSSDDVACVQARLGYFNERQNLLTKWFSLEYDQWFGYTLPLSSGHRAVSFPSAARPPTQDRHWRSRRRLGCLQRH
ncbi:hypothetical protein GS461_07850 [Rhodococcus hoagii]|nr:hypothetical protein [Prescottella equi]